MIIGSDSRRTIFRSAALFVGAWTVCTPVAAAASEALPLPLTTSFDGQNFTPGSDLPVFTDIGRVVPGDAETEQVWLRNNADGPGLLRIDLVNAQATDVDLARMTSLVFRDESGAELGEMTLEDAMASGQCAMVRNDLVVAAGETMRVDVALHVDDELGSRPTDDGRDGALQSVGFQLRATLSDQSAGPVDAELCPVVGDSASPAGDLPATGGQINVGIAIGAAALVVAGLFAVVFARRRRDRE